MELVLESDSDVNLSED